MKKLILFCFSLFLFCFAFTQNNLSGQLTQLKQTVESGHIAPKKIDDQFSENLFQLFIKTIDPSRLYFTQSDIKSLEKYRLALDEEINSEKSVFFNELLQLYKTKLKAADQMVTAITSKPFDFNTAEFYDHRRDTMFEADEKKLSEKWHLTLKSEVFNSLAGIAANQFANQKMISKQEVLAKETDARNKIRNKYQNKFKTIFQNETAVAKNLSNIYLNSFLNCMDPHSSYMDASEKQSFQSHLESERYYFGFSLGNTTKGEVAIIRLMPGGPAWSSGMINKDDVLLKMKWESKEVVELSGMDASEVSAMMDHSNTEKMELTLRKQSGEIQTVVLQKQKLDNEENIVKSYLLDGEKKIGYILLPSFYTQWEESSGSSCANDVAKEIIKLKKDDISGLILDLRFNGGGSLMEAVEMAGIFIEEGGVCQIDSKQGKIITLRDMNRGVIYSGPLILLVNDYSASASELLAGTLQDYNRALIVGSKTYGKATGQEIKPVENKIDPSVKGFVKLTNLKLYRITGKSSQMQGVQPDVVLPGIFQNFGEHEWNNPYAISPDTISAYKYFKPLKEINKSGLQQLSSERVTRNKFKELDIYRQQLEKDIKKERTSLKWEALEKSVKESGNSYNEKILNEPASVYKTANNSSDQKFISSNEIAKEINKRWLERIIQDPYVEETFLIMLDLIKANSF